MTLEDRRKLMEEAMVTDGCHERMQSVLSKEQRFERKVSKKIWGERVKELLPVLLLVVVIGVGFGEPIQATFVRWLNNFGIMAVNYEQEFAEYEQNIDVILESETGYSLHIFKIAQSRTTMVVEYELKDANGNVYEGYLEEHNLWKGHLEGYFAVHAGARQIAPNRENGHQRALFIYDRESGIDFTKKVGETQIARFEPGNVLINGKITHLSFPELEFVVDKVYEGKDFSYEEPLVVNDIPIYLREIHYEGVVLQLEVLSPAYLGLDHINSKLYVEIETDTLGPVDELIGYRQVDVLELEQEGGAKYRADEWAYSLDMFESKELRVTPVMQIGADWDTAEYIYGEEVVISLE